VFGHPAVKDAIAVGAVPATPDEFAQEVHRVLMKLKSIVLRGLVQFSLPHLVHHYLYLNKDKT